MAVGRRRDCGTGFLFGDGTLVADDGRRTAIAGMTMCWPDDKKMG